MKSKFLHKTNDTSEKRVSLYTIAKYANRELLLESLLQSKGSYQTLFLERYKKTQRTFKIKVIATKILYSIIFGILPILLILTYLEIIESLNLFPFSTENIILSGTIFFALYFVLQFFNFFLMGLLESSMVMSGLIFSWFETLPISRQRLKRLAYLTIFRTFDIPIILIVLGFPITILIQTQNILIFFVSLCISIINIIFSFDLLIIFGERLNRVLYSSPKKALMIRLLNILSYIAVILGSIYIIQWVLGSLDDIFVSILLYEQAPITNIILSTIPYPFNPSYLLSLVITPSQISFNLWISTFVGFGLFILITYLIHRKTSKILSQITTSSSINIQKVYVKKEIQIKIKTHSSVGAFLRKDLSVASHDIKVSLSLIMPIILSCIFTFSFNSGNINNPIFIERDIIVYCLGILIFSPVISGMLVYGISSIDISGETVLAALPINPRDRANAKLILMIILQTLALFSPSLLFILNPKFPIFFLATVISMPFVWIFLIFTFELKVFYFNKFRNRYVIGEIYTEKKIFKWTLIVCIQYILIFWMLSFILIFYINQQFSAIAIFYSITTLISFIFGTLVFNKMFPIIKERRLKFMKDAVPTILTYHTWISMVLIFILFYINLILSNFFLSFIFTISTPMRFDYSYYYNIIILSGVILFNFSFIPLFFIMFPRILGLPNGKQPIDQYLTSIKANWLISLKKALLWASVGIIAIFITNTIIESIYYPISEGFIYYDSSFIFIFLNSSIFFWQELFFRGIILTMLLRSRKKSIAIILNASLVLIYILITQLILNPFVPYEPFENYLYYLILPSLSIFLMQTILAFLCVKTNNILPGIIVQIILCSIYFPGVFPLVFYPLMSF